MKTDAEYAAVVAELEETINELQGIKQHSLHIVGVGTVYGDEMLITYLRFLAVKQEINAPQKCKPTLKLVE